MRVLQTGLGAAILVLAASFSAQAEDPPLFAAFKTFCMDTGARPLAAAAAISAAGGKPLVAPNTSIHRRFSMTTSVWNVSFGDRNLTVMSGHGSKRIKNSSDVDLCEIADIGDTGSDDAAVATIRAWVGIPPIRAIQIKNTIADYYVYEVAGSAHISLTSKADRSSASKRGEVWILTLTMQPIDQVSTTTFVQLGHQLPASDNPAPTQH